MRNYGSRHVVKSVDEMSRPCPRLQGPITRENFKLSYPHPEDFLLQRWQTTTEVDGHYLAFRVLYLLSITVQIHLLSRFTASTARLLYIYFTHWTFLSMGAYALAHMLAVLAGFAHQRARAFPPDGPERRLEVVDRARLHRTTLALANVAHNCALCVTICFWGAFWTQDGSDLTWACKMYHCWLALIIVWNYIVVSIRFRLEHAYLPFGFGLGYAMFSAGFYAAGGVDHRGRRYIYRLVDWEGGAWIAVLIVVISLLFVLLVQVVLVALDGVKCYAYRKYFAGGASEHEEAGRRSVPE